MVRATRNTVAIYGLPAWPKRESALALALSFAISIAQNKNVCLYFYRNFFRRTLDEDGNLVYNKVDYEKHGHVQEFLFNMRL